MFKIRKGVFETNSSSMHSLVVVKNPKPYSKEEMKFGLYRDEDKFKICYFSNEDDELCFDRAPFQVLRTPLEKLRYYVAGTLGNNYSDDDNVKKEKAKKLAEIQGLVAKYTGLPVGKIQLHATIEHWKTGKTTKSYGHIDHNDTGESVFEFIKRKGIEMEDFIMNPKYVVVVDGDELQEFKKLFESNVLNANDFEDISSGAKFWNDAEEEIHLTWFNYSWKKATPEEMVDRITTFTEALVIYISTDTYKDYMKHQDLLKEACAVAKTKNPNLKIILRNSRLYGNNEKPVKNVSALDTSFIDEIDLDIKDSIC